MPLPFILAIRKSAGSWFAGETPRLYFYTIKATSDCLHIQRIRILTLLALLFAPDILLA